MSYDEISNFGANLPEGVLDLVGRLYDAALDDRLWSGLGATFAAALGATSAALQLRDAGSDRPRMLLGTANLDAAALRAYEEYYGPRDPWFAGAAPVRIGEVIAGQEVIREADLVRTEFYQDYGRRVGAHHLAGVVFGSPGTGLAGLGLHRDHRGDAFGEADKRLIGAVLPHLQRALQLRRHLMLREIGARAAGEAAIRSGLGTIVATADGRIVHADAAAEAHLRRGDGIVARGGRLAAAVPAQTQALLLLIREAAATAATGAGLPGGTIALVRRDRAPLGVLVAPFRVARDGLGAEEPAAIILLREPDTASLSEVALRRLFGLTAAEAHVAAMLAKGRAVEEIAGTLGVTLNTVRTHLKRIMSKTDTTRQAQLVAVLLRSAASLGR